MANIAKFSAAFAKEKLAGKHQLKIFQNRIGKGRPHIKGMIGRVQYS